MESVTTRDAGSKAMTKVNRALQVNFVEAIETMDYRANIGRIYVKQFLKWITFLNSVQAKKIEDVMRTMASARLELLMLTLFASFLDLDLQETGAEQV